MAALPDDLADDLHALGLRGAAAARPLVGGRGGRTWRIDTDQGAFVLHRRRGPGHDATRLRREERSTALAHAALVGPACVARDDERGLLLTRWLPGRACTQERLADPVVLEQLATTLRNLHAAALPRHRVRPAADARRYLDGALRKDDPLTGALRATAEPLRWLGDLLDGSVPHDALVHGDLVPGNVILHRGGARLVDYEYAGRGDPAFDLGNLIASAALDRASARRLLNAYVDDDAESRRRWALRAEAWARVAQGGWVAWVVLGDDLGPHAGHWRRWATTAAADLVATQRRGGLRALAARLDGEEPRVAQASSGPARGSVGATHSR
jgi:thiamine kinase-like enzyme